MDDDSVEHPVATGICRPESGTHASHDLTPPRTDLSGPDRPWGRYGVPVRVERVQTQAVHVPLARPVRTASGTVDRAPPVLVDLVTTEGFVGHSYVFGYYPWALGALEHLVAALGELIHGDSLAPAAISEKLRARSMLLGAGNLVGMAISALDVAAWDALAQSAGLPLVRMLGGVPEPMSAYDSLGMFADDEAGEAAAQSVGAGFRALKIRLGFPTLAQDLAAVREARSAIPDEVALMVDGRLQPVPLAGRGHLSRSGVGRGKRLLDRGTGPRR
jgi:mandelate racemase